MKDFGIIHSYDRVCDSYVKNALKILLKEKPTRDDLDEAIAELYFCIKRTGTGLSEDLEKKLKKRGYKFK